jgi:hypothetical protein
MEACSASGSQPWHFYRVGNCSRDCDQYKVDAMKNRLTIVGLGRSMARVSRSCAALISVLEAFLVAGFPQKSSAKKPFAALKERSSVRAS